MKTSEEGAHSHGAPKSSRAHRQTKKGQGQRRSPDHPEKWAGIGREGEGEEKGRQSRERRRRHWGPGPPSDRSPGGAGPDS